MENVNYVFFISLSKAVFTGKYANAITIDNFYPFAPCLREFSHYIIVANTYKFTEALVTVAGIHKKQKL